MLKTFMQSGSVPAARPDTPRSPQPLQGVARSPQTQIEPEVQTAPQPRREAGSKLIVGPNIKLKGSEITDCEILVVEGRVEAAMNSRDILIAEGGVFSGKAEIDVAEVRGTFEGDLIARKRLVVYASGRVNGTIRYGAMQVEEGGVVSGNVALVSSKPTLARLPETSRGESEADAAESVPAGRQARSTG